MYKFIFRITEGEKEMSKLRPEYDGNIAVELSLPCVRVVSVLAGEWVIAWMRGFIRLKMWQKFGLT
jgi:hypothetical protein